ncbi:MAG: hypothetical protein QOF20_50 [Acidimicrobiaceae bacterium]|nr:hypothetical protein [Acidimicrobiaceae bacterium]MDQ1399594.1 hypothetical protein [Acidimicrobiaceae bacterium]MDQ1417238.1 hypothetical protein [Acidimicrobiaceae bacterium]
MRTMVMVELDTATANDTITSGKIGQILERVLGELKPESAYFYSRGGNRAFSLVVDIPDPSYIPSVVEPFWLEFNARVDAFPCMNVDELKTGLGRLAG